MDTIIFENEDDTENKDKIKESLEKKLEYEFNHGYESEFAHTLEKKISKKPCFMLCCFPFTILFSPLLCYLHYKNMKYKKQEQAKLYDKMNKARELRKTKEFKIQFIENKIAEEKLMIDRITKMNESIPNIYYKIELLEEKLKYFQEDK